MPQASPTVKNDLKYISKKDFSSAVAKWAVHLSPYSCPDNLDRVVIKADGAWPTVGNLESTHHMREWTYDDFREFVRNFIFNTPEILSWNHAKSGRVGNMFVSSFDLPINVGDDFIDLDALKMNIIRDCWTQVD